MSDLADDILNEAGVPRTPLRAVDIDDPRDVRHITATADPHVVSNGVFPTREALGSHPWSYPEDDEAPPLPAFPVHTLPGDMGKFAQALATYQQVSVDLPGMMLLGALSVIAGGYATVTGHWRENTLNLYLAALAGSGETKSDVVSAMVDPIRDLEEEAQEKYDDDFGHLHDKLEIAQRTRDDLIGKIAKAKNLQERKDYEADLSAVQETIKENALPPRPQFLEGDTTPEALGLTMQENGGHIGMLVDEGGFLGTLAGRYTSSGAANIDLVLQAFDAKMPVRGRRVGRGKLYIKRPSLAMAMCVQPAIIEEARSNKALLDRGLLYRFLFAKPVSLAGARDKRPPKVPDYLYGEWARIVRSVYETVLPDLLPFDPDTKEPRPPLALEISETAEELHYQWRVQLEKRVDPDTGDLAPLTGWAKKLEGAVYRIAALLHLASGTPGRLVDETAMRDAIAIGEWAIPHTVEALLGGPAAGSADADVAEKAVEAVLAWVRRKGIEEFTVRDVTYKLKKQTWVKQHGAAGVRTALRELARRGYLTSVKRQDAAGKELADGLFVVHPGVHGRPW